MWKSFFDYHMLIAKYRRDDKRSKFLSMIFKREYFGKFSSEVLKCGKNRIQLQGNKATDEELYRGESVSAYNLGLENKLYFVIGSLWAAASPGNPAQKRYEIW